MTGALSRPRCRLLLVFGSLLALLLAGQTRIHGPTQSRDFCDAKPVGFYHGSLSFGQIPAGQCSGRSFPAHGVWPGANLIPGWPQLPEGVVGMMYSGTDVVVVRLCAFQSAQIPDGLTYSAAIVATWR